MDRTEFEGLSCGDWIRRFDGHHNYSVDLRYNGEVIAVYVIVITNPLEWITANRMVSEIAELFPGTLIMNAGSLERYVVTTLCPPFAVAVRTVVVSLETARDWQRVSKVNIEPVS